MTGYGFIGPMTASGTVFDPKEEAVGGGGNMLMMGIGSIAWLLISLRIIDVLRRS